MDSKINLKILEVKKKELNPHKYVNLHPNLPDFNKPQVLLMIGSRNVGKSNLMVNITSRLDWGICDCLDEVFIVSPNALGALGSEIFVSVYPDKLLLVVSVSVGRSIQLSNVYVPFALKSLVCVKQ